MTPTVQIRSDLPPPGRHIHAEMCRVLRRLEIGDSFLPPVEWRARPGRTVSKTTMLASLRGAATACGVRLAIRKEHANSRVWRVE